MKKLNMKAKLLIGQVPAMVLIIAIVGIVIYLNTSNAILGMQMEVLQDFTNNGSNLVDEFFTQYETKAEIAAQSKDIREAITQKDSSLCMDTLQIIYEANKNQEGEYLLENLFVTDSEGVIIDDVLHGAIGIDLKTIPHFEANVSQGKLGNVHISVVSLSPVTGRPVILITAPVMSDSGKFLGLIGLPHETAFMFTNYIEHNKIGATGYSYICNNDGIVLAHPNEEMLGVNLKDDYEFGAGLFATHNDYFGYNWDGEDKTVYVQVNEKSGWYVMTGINDSEFKDITRSTILTIIIGVISIAIVSILIIYIMSTVIYKGIKSNMNGFIESSSQLEKAAIQFHESSQELSSGNQEQAASVEEISASISQTANMTAANTENTYEANKLSKNAQKSVSEANREMEVMQQTMEDIRRSSGEIGKILKVIEDIAFRTNMLALNAAVEAARAGDAGSGFAVVANEVKTLASKSQEAAQSSATMIENSITTANKGAEASNLVAQSLSSITEEIGKITVLMGEISVASEQQSQGIEQINVAVSQVETVTQQNADNAVNVANSAESLNLQVNKINGYVGDLSRILDGEKKDANTQPDIMEIEESTTLMLEE